jgi:NAD(P)-dependent dehydrogenase (short-subunit alcohol dehydrogenase family)
MKLSLDKDNKKDCSIINVSSIAAEIGMPNTSVYAYSKAGIASITRVATIELNEYALKTNTSPIRVNAVLPGVIRTPMHGRFLDDNGLDGIPPSESSSPEELAKCIITRLNEKFSMGSISIIDGGYTAQ